MYVKCKEGDEQFIVDTEKKEVYKLFEGDARLIDLSMDNFLRFRPYLKVIKETEQAPAEIKEYRERHNASK